MAVRVSTRIKRQRIQALREFRRTQRAVDSALEVLERRINRILDNKMAVTAATVQGLVPHYRTFWGRVREMERALADLVQFVTEQSAELMEVLEG